MPWEATFDAPSGLFRQFLDGVLGSSLLTSNSKWAHSAVPSSAGSSEAERAQGRGYYYRLSGDEGRRGRPSGVGEHIERPRGAGGLRLARGLRGACVPKRGGYVGQPRRLAARTQTPETRGTRGHR